MSQKAMHTKERLVKREQLKAKRLEKTQAYLESIGVMIPIIEDARQVKTADIIKNEDFIKKIDVFVLDYLGNNTDDKVAQKKLAKKSSRKVILNKFIKERLEPIIKELPKLVWDSLLSAIMVDSIPDVDGEWLDFELPLFQSCMDTYNDGIAWLRNELSQIGMLDLKDDIADYIDYVCMLISINLFRFSRKLDEQSRYQMMGNIGSLEDIRAAVELVFIGEIFSCDKNIQWFNIIVKDI